MTANILLESEHQEVQIMVSYRINYWEGRGNGRGMGGQGEWEECILSWSAHFYEGDSV